MIRDGRSTAWISLELFGEALDRVATAQRGRPQGTLARDAQRLRSIGVIDTGTVRAISAILAPAPGKHREGLAINGPC